MIASLQKFILLQLKPKFTFAIVVIIIIVIVRTVIIHCNPVWNYSKSHKKFYIFL